MKIEDGTFEFETVWPELSGRLRRVIRSRRVPPDAIDDLVQETGLRLYRSWHRIDPQTVWALANTIILNLVRDEMRRQEVRARLSPTPNQESESRLDESVLALLELKRVRKVLTKLSPVDRNVLLAELGEARDPEFVTPAAYKMARMRARRRLRAALERASALVPMWKLRRGIVAKGHLVNNVAEQWSQLAFMTVAIVASTAALGASSLAGHDPGEGAFLQRSTPMSASSRDDATGHSSAGGGHSRIPHSRAVEVSEAVERRDAGPTTRGASSGDAMNENFGPVRSADDGVHVGEGGNGLGPYGTEQGYETSAGGEPAGAHARARYDAPKCHGDIHIGGQSTHKCDGPGRVSAGAEADAAGHHEEAGTPEG